MADITMCANDDCPWASTCYRHQATPGAWQSWAMFRYTMGHCEFYWPIGGKSDGSV